MRGASQSRNGQIAMKRVGKLSAETSQLLLLVLTNCLLLARDACAVDIDGCNTPLGMESRKIKDSAITASSAYDAGSVGPHHGRLHNAKNGGAWCPRQMVSRDSKEYLQVDLEEEYVITALHTQGRFGNGQGQEYAEGYMVDYWRSGMAEGAWKRWKNRVGKELLTGNTDTYSIVEQKLDPPVIASKIRFSPYSDHVRTVCMRVEILGCRWKEGILSYNMPQGVKVSSDLDLTDRTYDGVEEMGHLSNGLGQLVDGKKGKDNFNLDISGLGKGYEWVGWTNDTASWAGLPLEITFEFDKVRNFSAAYLHTNNLFTSDVQVFSHARVFFSTNGHFFNPEPVHFSYMPDLVMEHSRNVTIKLHHRFGRYLKIQLYFASKWILLSEVAFESVPASGNFTDLIEDDTEVPPVDPEYPPQRDEVKSTTSKVANLTVSQSKTDGRTDAPESYIGFIIGTLTVVILILVAAIAFIAFRNQRIKTITGLTAIPTVRSDLGCEKVAVEADKDFKPMDSVDRPELYARHVAHNQHPISPDYSEVPDLVSQEYAAPTHRLASKIEKGKPVTVTHSLLLKPPPVPPPPKGYYTQREINSVTLPPSPPLSPTVPSVFNSLKNHFMLPLSPEPDEETASAGDSSSALEEESQVPIQRFPREKFRIVDKIGEGHFGDVHLCEMLESPEDAPNKLVVLHTLKVETFRGEFVLEVKALARLKDPNVSRLLGASLDEEPLYAVREYGVMGDLCQFLQDHVAETATPLAPSACTLSTLLVQNEYILGYFGSDTVVKDNITAHWLVVQYHPLDSLSDYLKTTVLSATQMLTFCLSIVNGLAHLHYEIYGTQGKPALAHRDLKSKNILVKSDGTCCIGDFGLAISQADHENQHMSNKLVQAGTIRYMSPEVLDMSIRTDYFESFRKADIYALSLIFWEICRRTMTNNEVDDKNVPYFHVMPMVPTIEEMRKIVCEDNIRPLIMARWSSDYILAGMVAIIKECWHQNPNARLSALRIKKSLLKLTSEDALNSTI